MFISDQETEVDLLYYESIARTLIRLIADSGDKPLTIGVHGDWGAGKTSGCGRKTQDWTGSTKRGTTNLSLTWGNEDAARISNHERLSAVLTFLSPKNDS